MKRYRICSLDTDGQITLVFEMACRDDLDALAEGESIAARNRVEVWDGRRLVARVKPGNAPLDAHDRQCL